ncbi:hypothetical protein V493_06929, partial [Pseudogymnoascus sp. VKM F-4281 (FW-2241)]
MTCESSVPRRPLRAFLPALRRRPHATRRPMQSEGRSRAAASWSSMPVSQFQAASDELVSGRPHSKYYRGVERPTSLPVPSAAFEIVSAMPQCLQSRAPKTSSLDLPAWVENTNRHTLQSGGGIVDDELVPWMQLPQPEFSGIKRAQYRETALYSEPGSHDLSRAYATDEVACPQPRPPVVSWASWATFGMGDNYSCYEEPFTFKRGVSSVSGVVDDITYYADASGEDRDSVSSRRGSSLSIKCQGHNTLEVAPLAFGQQAAQRVEDGLVPNSYGSEFMDWAENGSSGRSSPCYSEWAYEEFATPLAPARARIVHISGDFSQFPTRSTTLFRRDSCEASIDEVTNPDLSASQESTPETPPESPSTPFPPYHH